MESRLGELNSTSGLQTRHTYGTHPNYNVPITGVGCSKNHADNWVAHQDDFNALLATLNTENSAGADSDLGTHMEHIQYNNVFHYRCWVQ